MTNEFRSTLRALAGMSTLFAGLLALSPAAVAQSTATLTNTTSGATTSCTIQTATINWKGAISVSCSTDPTNLGSSTPPPPAATVTLSATTGNLLGGAPGTRWKYANNDTLLLMRALRHPLGDDLRYLRFPYDKLDACRLAWQAGVRDIRIVDGRGPGGLECAPATRVKGRSGSRPWQATRRKPRAGSWEPEAGSWKLK